MEQSHIPQMMSSDQDDSTHGTTALEQQLLGLIDSRILNRLSQQKYSFNNKLTWEVVYEGVMFSEKRRLHNRVGLYIENNNKVNLDSVANLLLHHFESAQNHQKTAFYAALAGDRAARMFARDEAIHLYGRALDALLKMAANKPVDRSLVLEKCGDVYRKSGDYQEAIEQYHAAFSAWKEAGHDKQVNYLPWEFSQTSRNSSLCRKIAVSYEYASDYAESASWIDKAVRFLPDDSEKTASKVYTAKSATHFRKGEYEEAIDWGERALGIAELSGNLGDLAYSHNIIANTFIHLGKLGEAIQHLQQAIALYSEQQDIMGMASANSNLGSCYLLSDKLEYAIRHYQVALDAEKRIQNDARVAIDHNNLGEVYLMQGRLGESAAMFSKVIVAHEKGYAHNALAGYAMMNVSRCSLYSGDLDEASDTIGKALGLIEDAGVIAIYLEAQLQHASVLLAQEQLDDAGTLCEHTRQEIKDHGINLLGGKADRVLAKIFYKKGDTQSALTAINNSIKLANSIGSKFEEGKSLNEYARMLIETGGQMKQLTTSLDRAKKIFSHMGAARELAYTEFLKTRLAQLTEQE